MTKRKNNYLEQLQRRRQEAKAPAVEEGASLAPEQEPEWEPETPEVRVQVLEDRLAERDAQLAIEQERRRAAERKVERSHPAAFGTIFKRNRPYFK
jgi:hypothetical protein